MIYDYLLFHILAAFAFSTFIVSLLWTTNIIKDVVIFVVTDVKIRLRNIIDFLMMVSRVILPLPFFYQMRFNINLFTIFIGCLIVGVGVLSMVLGLISIYPRLRYERKIDLVTTGIYGIVRHPIYFGDSIWPLGWSIIFGSQCSSLMTPIWFLMYVITIRYEESALVREYGEKYRKYQKRVKRIIPYVY